MTHKGTVTLETERLILRALSLDDFEAAHSWGSNPQNTRYMAWGPSNEEQTRAFLQSVKPGEDFAVVLKETGAVIGSCGIYPDERGDTGDLGWILHIDYWKRGFGTELGGAIIKYGFEELKLRRIFATCAAVNYGSYRVMERNGMRREALHRKAFWARIDKEWIDRAVYAILAEDYFTPVFAPYDLALDRKFLTAAHGETFKLTFKLEQKPEWLDAELAKPRDVRDGAYIGGKLAGVCDLQRRSKDGFGDYGRANFFFIAPEYRNRGLGGQLIAHAAEWCRSQGLDRLTLNTGKDNYQAQKCYEKNGFVRYPQIDSENEFGYIKNII